MGSRVDSLEEILVVKAGISALLCGVFPVGGVIVIVNGALVDILLVVGLKDVVRVLLVVHGSGGHFFLEGGLLLLCCRSLKTDSQCALWSLHLRWQGALIFVGGATKGEHGLLFWLQLRLHGVCLLAQRVIAGRATQCEHGNALLGLWSLGCVGGDNVGRWDGGWSS